MTQKFITTRSGYLMIEQRPGYEFDPYKGEEATPFFIGTFIARFTGEKDGFLSTYREWHIFLAGVSAGFHAPTFANVPQCPPLWTDEMQYFDTPAIVTNVIKCQWPVLAAVIMGKLGGVI